MIPLNVQGATLVVSEAELVLEAAPHPLLHRTLQVMSAPVCLLERAFLLEMSPSQLALRTAHQVCQWERALLTEMLLARSLLVDQFVEDAKLTSYGSAVLAFGAKASSQNGLHRIPLGKSVRASLSERASPLETTRLVVQQVVLVPEAASLSTHLPMQREMLALAPLLEQAVQSATSLLISLQLVLPAPEANLTELGK
jgi:hypothetical protein